ncbi:MAG: hypothetical protein JW892_04245, partial [Anaerolineae bacterium]|nr:hypothetical protein [Anaerolineae bacterium]
IARMRRTLRRRYGRLYRQGIETISERPYDCRLVLREDAPFENPLMPDRRWLLLLSTARPSAAELSLLAGSDHALTAVVLGVPADQSSKPMMERLPELFVLDHFLYPGDGVRFLLYLFRSRQFDRVIVWDDPIINGMIPLLQMHFPQVMYQTWEQVQATEPAFDGTTYSAAPPDNVSAQTFAAQAIAAYVAQKRASYPHKRFELLRRLGRFGVGLFLLKERLAYWGHRARQRLRLFVGGRTRCT